MSSSRVNRQKRRKEARQKTKQRETARERLEEQLEAMEEENLEILERELEEMDDEELEEVSSDPATEIEEKAYLGDAVPVEQVSRGPLTFEEMEVARETREKAAKVEMLSYDTQDIVHNILNVPELDPTEKATKIKAAADGFSKRVQDVMDSKIIKETLEENEPTILERLYEFVQKRKLSSGARSNLPDSAFALPKKRKYPIHDKAHVRNALARAAQMLKRGGEAAADARAALPKIRAAAKKFGIEVSTKSESGFIVEKDSTGQYRAIMWPSNNFIDRDGDIIAEEAHQEYVEWARENEDLMPALLAWHVPETKFKNHIDYVDYVDGFLFMSAPLTDDEARVLKEMSEKTELGMSHGSFVLGRDPSDPRVVTQYRMFEASFLPLEHAANPFTALETFSKEARMDIKEFLTGVFDGDEEKAEKYLDRRKKTKEALQEADVEHKEVKPEEVTPAEETPAVDMDALIEKVGEEYDMEGLSEFVVKAKEAIEQVQVLKELVTELTKEREEQLEELISPKVGKHFAWSEKMASASEETEVEEDDPILDETPLAPDGWLSQLSQTKPVANPS